MQDGALVPSYAINGDSRTQCILMVHTPWHFGGNRAWFICPVRGERVAVLYMRGGRFACRHCQRVAYLSQSEDALGRAWRKQHKAEAKLGPDGERPRGMHSATYERLSTIICECEELRDRAPGSVLHRWGVGGF